MIAIIDYGVGNLFSLKSSLKQLGLEAVVTADADTIRKADRLILPGVGAFADAMAKLEATGLVPVMKEEAERKPLLGICLGMQLLFEKSYEYGEHEGLGFVKGEVCPLEPDLADKSLKVPQIGWNALHIVKDDPLFKYIREGEYVYYVHSYYGKNCTESTLAVSDYSIPVTGAVQGAHILLRAVRCVARLVQPGKMLGPDLAVVGVVFRRECSLAAAIVKRQRCGQDSVGKIGGSPAQQVDIIQYKL